MAVQQLPISLEGLQVRGGFGHIGVTVPDVYAACERFKVFVAILVCSDLGAPVTWSRIHQDSECGRNERPGVHQRPRCADSIYIYPGVHR